MIREPKRVASYPTGRRKRRPPTMWLAGASEIAATLRDYVADVMTGLLSSDLRGRLVAAAPLLLTALLGGLFI